jgi:hypothetical protein
VAATPEPMPTVGDTVPDRPPGFWSELWSELRVLSPAYVFFARTDLYKWSVVDPQNQVAKIPSDRFGIHLRPDLSLDHAWFSLSAKPRYTFETVWLNGTDQSPPKTEHDLFLQEGRVMVRLPQGVFLSASREVIQWGSSIAFSPSNPFLIDDGRTNPKLEIGGLDLAKITVIPNPTWSVALIGALGKGRDARYSLPFAEFKRTYALKIDYQGSQNSASLIGSYRENGIYRAGGTGVMNASKAVVLYGEGDLSLGSEVLYPEHSAEPPEFQFEQRKLDHEHLIPSTLAGASYSFESGLTFSGEYIYNGHGYTDRQASRYFELTNYANRALALGGLATAYGTYLTAQALNPGMRFLRRHYLSGQVLQLDIKNQLDVIARLIYSVADHSWQAISIVDWHVADSLSVFFVGMASIGQPESDFGRLVRSQVFAGLTVHPF